MVGSGVKRGRTIGFPTANLEPEATRLLPAIGTYGGVGILNGEIYPAVCNVGLSPTFGDQLERRVEVHLLGYCGEPFYGQPLTFQFLKKLRDECRFESVQALVDQIKRDCAQVDPRWVEEAKILPLSPCI
jgi:riboflavin kinase/FMN adenylyltransferase